jgi:hypothetical protein
LVNFLSIPTATAASENFNAGHLLLVGFSYKSLQRKTIIKGQALSGVFEGDAR